MTVALYALSFIPMLLLTLTVHELGHLLVARINGAKAGGFQIGGGWRIITAHTGRTHVELPTEIPNLNPDSSELRVGDLASYYVRKQNGRYAALAVLPRNGTPLARERWEEVREYNQNYMRLNGKIREISQEAVVLADMDWSLKVLPLMAGVILTEDPREEAREAYNTMSWGKKTLLTAAGPAANILLMIMALAIAATFPLGRVGTAVLEVQGTETGSPARTAGVMQGDHIVRVGNTPYPGLDDLRRETRRALRNNRTVQLGIQRNGENLQITVMPSHQSGRLGITVGTAVARTESNGYAMTPGAIGNRILRLGRNYAGAVGAMVTTLGDAEERGAAVAGPVMGSYQTARAVEIAGLQAWLVILATLNLGVAVTNLIPVPPLDGYRITAETIQSIRGKPINPRVEKAMFMGGMGLILGASLYLFLKDLRELLG